MQYDKDDENVDMTPFLNKIGKEIEKESQAYRSGSWLNRVKYRMHFAKYWKNPLKGLLFGLFGRVEDNGGKTV